MDKTVLKNFAIESRKDLMEKIDRKIKLFYVDEEFKKDNRGDVIVLSNDKHTLTLTKDEDANRDKLLKRIIELGYEQVVEEAAYTWFNRIIAIRFMEIHDYLPLTKDNLSIGIRVLSSQDNKPIPDILKFSNITNQNLDINFSKEKYLTFNKDDDKFKYVLLLICNKLGTVIPQVFDGVTDYIDLLVPDNLLSEEGFISKMLTQLPEVYFNEVEIIGWLYQYYNQTEKDRVISEKNTYKKNEIAYATQIFTPDWIVKYMVDNSLGKFYFEHGGDFELKSSLSYYVESDLNKYDYISPEDITFIDPCCGSGHILVYAFEVLFKIYEKAGYNKKDISELILKNNLFGIDIDDRAGQLAILSVLLKAREYDKNIFDKTAAKNINILSVIEPHNISEGISNGLDGKIKESAIRLVNDYTNSKEFGSLIQPHEEDYESLEIYLNRENNIYLVGIRDTLLSLIKLSRIMSKKYNVVVTNPPYMNTSVMTKKMKDFLIEYYDDYKTDLFSAFVKRNSLFGNEDSYLAFMTPNVWMFIASYEKMRKFVTEDLSISSLIQLAKGAFFKEATVDICSFVLKNKKSDLNGAYYRLEKYKGDMNAQEQTFLKLLNTNSEDIYYKNSQDFKKIPGSPIAYWVSEDFIDNFTKNKLSDYYYSGGRNKTHNNEKYTRYWWEISDRKKWQLYVKGGDFRRWYGNHDNVVDWSDSAKKEYDSHGGLYNQKFSNKIGICWTLITSSITAFRVKVPEAHYDSAAPTIFNDDFTLDYYTLGFLNSNVATSYLQLLNPTLNMGNTYVLSLPLIYGEKSEKDLITDIVKNNINLAKEDWDSFENSTDFKKHPLLEQNCNSIKAAFDKWEKKQLDAFNLMKNNEETINKHFCEKYNLSNEISYIVEDKYISVRLADKERDIKSLISYAVGCMFGRYSLDSDGLVCTDCEFNKNNYRKYIPDDDNIIPITDNNDIYFNDDIVGKFIEFIKSSFSPENVNENIDYIAEVLGKKGTESSKDTIRRYFINDFYSDHLKFYQKKPIYWLFDSGKKNGFKCLVYLHRYNEQIVSKIRTKYLHNTISIYQRNNEEIDYKLNNENLSTSEKRELQNKKVDLNAKITECNEYEEMVGNVANKMIKLDLDDGVVNNYAKFVDDNGKSILAKIK